MIEGEFILTNDLRGRRRWCRKITVDHSLFSHVSRTQNGFRCAVLWDGKGGEALAQVLQRYVGSGSWSCMAVPPGCVRLSAPDGAVGVPIHCRGIK